MGYYDTPNPNRPWWSAEKPVASSDPELLIFIPGFCGLVTAFFGVVIAAVTDAFWVNGAGTTSADEASGNYYATIVLVCAVIGVIGALVHLWVGPSLLYKPIEHSTRRHQETWESFENFSEEKQNELRDTYEFIMEMDPQTPDERNEFKELVDVFNDHSLLYDQRESLLRRGYNDPRIEEAKIKVKMLRNDIRALKEIE